jgi:hypothetical protein
MDFNYNIVYVVLFDFKEHCTDYLVADLFKDIFPVINESFKSDSFIIEIGLGSDFAEPVK